jgi:serine/threonine-protein kinase
MQEKLGAGGMAVVYRAVNEESGQTVALKVLRASVAEQKNLVERFQQEVSIVQRLKHRCIVPVYNYGEIRGRHFMEMEYMSGGTLASRFQKPREITAQEAVRLLRDIASALDFAHQQGVIHRDIKLENILLRGDSSAALSDFGIARAADGTRLTVSGSIIGTPLYLSPEQAMGQEADYRADLYSFAVVAYVLTVGRFPFNGDNFMAVMAQHLSADPLAPSEVNPSLPQALDAVLLKGLAKRREDRPRSADMLVEGIARALSDQSNRKTMVDITHDTAGKPILVDVSLVSSKTADELVAEAQTATDPQKAIALLKQALELEPLHSKANRLLLRLEGTPSKGRQPVPPMQPVVDAQLKKPKRKQQRGVWEYLLLLATGLLLLVIAFIALRSQNIPVDEMLLRLFRPAPVLSVNGTPAAKVPGIALTVRPARVERLAFGERMTNVLENGIAHEYVFYLASRQKDSVVITYTPANPHDSSALVGVLDPRGQDAAKACSTQVLPQNGGLMVTCQAYEAGDWRLRLFGADGINTGTYTIILVAAP